MKDILQNQLKKDPAVIELLSGLKEGRGPAAVFSLPDAARAPVFAALSEERTTLIVLDTEAAAIDLYNEIKAYRPDALPFLPRELPLVHVQAAAPERRSQRLGVLSRLVLGVPTLIVLPYQPVQVLHGSLHPIRGGLHLPGEGGEAGRHPAPPGAAV